MIVAAFVLLAIAGACFFYRLAVGPSLADRITAVDGMLAVGANAIAVEAVRSGFTSYLAILVVLALVGFISTAVVSKLVGRGL